jgi:hypothetical protein
MENTTKYMNLVAKFFKGVKILLCLDKNHDPIKNKDLIANLLDTKTDLKNAIKETDELFDQYSSKRKQRNPFIASVLSAIKKTTNFLPVQKRNDISWETDLDENGFVYPIWKNLLDQEYIHLMSKIDRIVNVLDYGAIGDGKTDNTKAFQKAIGNGRVIVHVPEGIFLTKGIKLPSWTCLIGKGKGITTIKLHPDAPIETRLVTNANHRKGNHHILVKGMSLDWNIERLGHTERTSAGGHSSSCFTFANVKYGWVKQVEAINPGLHCFDVSSTRYHYAGDGKRARGRSRYIWLDQLNGYGFGDDGITTHHSDYVFISNSHMCDPSGRAHPKGISNSNGIEVDDGSRNIWLVHNSTSRCFGGVEIKAHHNASAASNIYIIGHLSVHDNRSYNFRHIGHHKISDPESKTAYNIKATMMVSIAPIYTDLYQHSSPRGLVVSAYRNVVINHFTLIGDPDYDYKGNPVIAIQYRARNIVLNHVSIRNFHTAGADIKIFGGPQRADDVTIRHSTIRQSAPLAIQIGAGVQNIHVHHLKAFNQNGKCGLKTVEFPPSISNFQTVGYKMPICIK